MLAGSSQLLAIRYNEFLALSLEWQLIIVRSRTTRLLTWLHWRSILDAASTYVLGAGWGALPHVSDDPKGPISDLTFSSAGIIDLFRVSIGGTIHANESRQSQWPALDDRQSITTKQWVADLPTLPTHVMIMIMRSVESSKGSHARTAEPQGLDRNLISGC